MARTAAKAVAVPTGVIVGVSLIGLTSAPPCRRGTGERAGDLQSFCRRGVHGERGTDDHAADRARGHFHSQRHSCAARRRRSTRAVEGGYPMMRLRRASLLVVAFSLLTTAATAYAECAWVMWEQTEYFGKDRKMAWTIE